MRRGCRCGPSRCPLCSARSASSRSHSPSTGWTARGGGRHPAHARARGAVVLVDRAGFEPNADPSHDTHPPVPEVAIDELRVRWLGPDRRAGAGFRNTSPGGEDDVFRAVGFGPEETVVVPDGRAIHPTVGEVVARVLSSSWTAPHLFGARLPEFERELRGLLLDASPEGRFTVWLPDNRLRIWRPTP